MKIELTDKAKAELLNLGVGTEKFLRVDVVPGGCSGMTYNAEIDDTEKETDKLVLEIGAIRLFASKTSTQFLDGLTIDYSDDLVQSGFRFKNATASKSCGCGASFQV